ncbi:hypothetical protein [Nonomuraea sp. NPDC048826]|uniref:hypothetical protein n=1 Tax=Nonomuraea sp. NPDC048826 TaxID=3364347 RepID=UPI0037227E49
MTALATAATSVLLVAGPATAEDARRCATGTVPTSGSVGAVTAPAHSMETRRLVEELVQVVKPGPAASGSLAPAPTLDRAGAKALLRQIACRSGDDDGRYEREKGGWHTGADRLPDREWVPGGGSRYEREDDGWHTGADRLPDRDWLPGKSRESWSRTRGLSGGVAEDENCVRYRVGPGWSPNWPVLDALGVRELIEQSSGTASVCVGDPNRLPGQAPSTTAVEPQVEPQAGTQGLTSTPAKPAVRVKPVQFQPEARPQIQAEPRFYPYAQVHLQSNGRPLLESLGVTALLRDLVGN